MSKEAIKSILKNKKALHRYEVVERLEAGIVLVGTEVKSVREGNLQAADAYGKVVEGEVFLYNLQISRYESRGYVDHRIDRPRKLLLHRREIRKLGSMLRERGFTLIPLSFYFKGGVLKVEVGVCRGKKLYDKREEERRKDDRRYMAAAAKRR